MRSWNSIVVHFDKKHDEDVEASEFRTFLTTYDDMKVWSLLCEFLHSYQRYKKNMQSIVTLATYLASLKNALDSLIKKKSVGIKLGRNIERVCCRCR